MVWTKITRGQYLRDGLRYAGDMKDEEWRLIARRLPPRRRLGRPRKVDFRNVIEVILYVLSTGCQWRALPREFPPYSTVLRVARQRAVAQARQGSGSVCSSQTGTQAEPDGGDHRQPKRCDNTGWRITRL
jgi:hypothetical protein